MQQVNTRDPETGRLARIGDGRTPLGKWLRQQYEDLTASLGGEPTLTHQQRSLARRAVFLELELAQLESRMSTGAGVEAAKYVQLVNCLSAAYTKLGLGGTPARGKRGTTPTALDYLSAQQDDD